MATINVRRIRSMIIVGVLMVAVTACGSSAGVSGSARPLSTATAPTPASSSSSAPAAAVASMTEDEFWGLMRTIPGHIDQYSAVKLTTRLANESASRIESFADLLAAALYAIDSSEGADQLIRDPTAGDTPMTMSDDLFLYARCAVVSSGRSRWASIVADPSLIAGRWWAFDGEFLLYVAPHAYVEATGLPWEHESPVSFETGSNPAGWPTVAAETDSTGSSGNAEPPTDPPTR